MERERLNGEKKTINILDINVDNIVVSKLVERKTSSKYLVGYLGKVLRSLVLVLLKISEYAKTFTVQEGNKDKNNKLMSVM